MSSVDWEQRWVDGNTPWDFGAAHPFLVHKSSSFPLTGGALVPGCGSGYDVLALARGGAERTVIGLDLSEVAIKRAVALRDGWGVSAERARFVAADFFEYDGDGGRFELVYDYTFFCALPPAWRERWAAKMAQLVSPGGRLFTLMFPVYGSGDGSEGGPPFSVSPEAYATVLEPVGFAQEEGGAIPSEYARDYSSLNPSFQERYAIWVLRKQ